MKGDGVQRCSAPGSAQSRRGLARVYGFSDKHRELGKLRTSFVLYDLYYCELRIWAKDVIEFVVPLSFVTEAEGSYDCVPKLILAKLGNPKRIRCTIQNDRVLVCNVDSQ